MLDLALVRLGWPQTAQRLRVSSHTLDEWVLGSRAMPDDKFLKLVEIIDQTMDG
jgi:DNA-binding transcriptional regulator YiaG